MLVCHRIDLSTSPRADNALVFGAVPSSSKLADWLTSPRAYSDRRLVRYPDLQTGRLDDQSPSIQCSVVGAVPRYPNWQTGRPVPEHTVLGGRCSPQISILADWTTSPQAYSAWWSMQSPGTLILHQFFSVILKNILSHKWVM